MRQHRKKNHNESKKKNIYVVQKENKINKRNVVIASQARGKKEFLSKLYLTISVKMAKN